MQRRPLGRVAPPRLVALLALFAAPGAEAVGAALARRAAERDVAACNCECCEVEAVRDPVGDDVADGAARLQCSFAEPGVARTSSLRAQTPNCGTFCLRSDSDQVLVASESAQLDTQRFCFFECAPESPSGASARPGDSCRRLRPDEEQALAAASMNAGGDGVPPMEQADTAPHFLAPRGAIPGVAVVDAQPVAPGGVPAARRPQLSLAFARSRNATNGTNGTNASVTPWESVNDPMPEEHAKFLQWAQDAQKAAQKALEEEKAVRELAGKATNALPVAMAAVADAKSASEEAHRDEGKIRQMLSELRKETHKEAFGALRDLVPQMKKDARRRAEKLFRSRAAELQKQMLAEAPKAAARAEVPWQEAAKRASQYSVGWVERGNLLSSRAAQLSAQAERLQGSADQWLKAAHIQGSANVVNATGDAVGAKRMLREAQSMIAQAEDLNRQASVAFDTAIRIDGTLPMYGREAAQAAYHEERMLNPDAPPPRVVV